MQKVVLGDRTFLVDDTQQWHICYHAKHDATAIVATVNTRRRYFVMLGNHLDVYEQLMPDGLEAVLAHYRNVNWEKLHNDLERGL
jgi:type II secretory pathway component PulL